MTLVLVSGAEEEHCIQSRLRLPQGINITPYLMETCVTVFHVKYNNDRIYGNCSVSSCYVCGGKVM